MQIYPDQHRPFGNTGLRVPPVMFGSAALSDAHRVIPERTKLALCGEWFRHVTPPVFTNAGGNDGSTELALQMLGRALGWLEVSPEEVVINIMLDSKHAEEVQRSNYGRIIDDWEQGCRWLGGRYLPQLTSLLNPDEYLATAESSAERERRFQRVLDACRALGNLKDAGKVAAVGVVAKDWRIVKQINDAVPIDWVMLVGGFTVMRHSPELVEFLATLAERQIAVVAAGVFHCGFLVGAGRFDGRLVSADSPADSQLFAWRKSFAALCQGHGVTPAHACIQFPLCAPGITAVALNTSHPDRVAENVKSVLTKVPDALWASMKEEGLLAEDYIPA